MNMQEIEVSRWKMLARWVEAMRAKAAGEDYDKQYDAPNYMHDMMLALRSELPESYLLEQAESWKGVPLNNDGTPMDIPERICRLRRRAYLLLAADNKFINALRKAN